MQSNTIFEVKGRVFGLLFFKPSDDRKRKQLITISFTSRPDVSDTQETQTLSYNKQLSSLSSRSLSGKLFTRTPEKLQWTLQRFLPRSTKAKCTDNVFRKSSSVLSLHFFTLTDFFNISEFRCCCCYFFSVNSLYCSSAVENDKKIVA